jgi:outer membrane receptor protein involved in Fe transport
MLSEFGGITGWTKNYNLNGIGNKDTVQYSYNTGNNPLDALRLKIDYELKIGRRKYSMGYQYRTQSQNGSFTYEEKSGNFTPLILIPQFTADVQVANRVHGIYTQYASDFSKLQYIVGMRYENAYRSFNDNKGNPATILSLSNFFPSVNLLYSLNESTNFKAGYSRRVQRSTNNELNPYPEREHSETLEQGDPNIRPEFIGIYELGITKDFKKSTLFWNAYYQSITDIVNRVNSVYNDSILNRIFTNAGKATLVGSELGLTLSPISKLKFYVGGNIYKLAIKGDLFDNTVSVNTSGWVHSVNSNINYQIAKSLSTQFNLNNISERKTAQGEDSRFYQPNFSIKKVFANNRLTALLQWQNVAFGSMGVNEQRITTRGSNFFTTTNYVQEQNIFLINLGYNFNIKDKKAKLPSSEFGEKEF